MKKRVLALLMVTCVAGSLLAGCGNSSEESTSEESTSEETTSEETESEEASSEEGTSEEAEAATDDSEEVNLADGEGMTLGVSWNFMINESATETQAFLDEYAEEYGINIVHLVADGDSAQQITDVKDLISKGCDVIAVVPVDSAAIPTMVNAVHEAGIPYINFNRPVAEEDLSETPDASFAPDSKQQAVDSAAACIQEMLDAGIEEIKVIDIIGSLTDENAVNRDAGLKEAIDDAVANGADIEIVAELECDWDNEWITSNLPAAVTAHPEANMLFVPSDYCAGAVASSLETADRWLTRDEENHLWIASQDVYIDGYQYMVDGYFDANALLSNSILAEKVIEGAVKLYTGGSYGDNWNIATECPLFTPDNCQDPEMIDLLSYKDQL